MIVRSVALSLSLAVVVVTSCATLAADGPRPPRFFFSGDGTLALTNAHSGEKIDVRYRGANGAYDEAALAQINHLMRSRDGSEGDVSLRLVELLAYIQHEFKPTAASVISGYRSPEYNAGLSGAAESSLHTQGLAADVMFQGVDLTALWKTLRDKRVGGVGLYLDDGYLHIDTGPPRFWEKQTSRVGENLSAGNARVFARTQFDINSTLSVSPIELHSVTVFPLRLATKARLKGYPDAVVQLEPFGAEDCIEIAAPAPHHRIYIDRVENMPKTLGKRTRILLSTCEPRSGQTPKVIESNEIEIGR
jgi:uncharacterized protein YcbK (DUF882 family)